MAVDFTYDFNTDAVTGAAIQTSLDELNTALFALTDSNFSSNAAIAKSRLASMTTDIYYTLPIVVQSQLTAAGWPGGDAIMGFVPVEEGTSIVGIEWACDDYGGGAGIGDVEYGYFSGGAWNMVTSLSTLTFSTDAGSSTIAETVLSTGVGIRCLAIKSTTADATMLTGADGDHLIISCRIKKNITF